ncbi:carboxymethylenebutenolidase [Marchantia polymorpha subsp. ruderalis]|uniref:Dienelactone hydrolase domain-containing protein n=2 Tax=Marchantia polymorpha TaxID=3197 RepID=A0A176W2I1_MARPO|nr:hypothetical protein AXG93_59s1190 [Marchantia polymorpha subsp. ruderalis]PTQ40249.1 hypothetical protein MARPO_0041s0110 [Marchantia polymorpha]BBN09261.1 hypothetical protein Mp_4g18290 [Marchantia polymorpha subsp. ruderalis]|eukprot:PTQ40249.1 hypothetical protein MARPO_0041s0110 [Marchantia polymorpha]
MEAEKGPGPEELHVEVTHSILPAEYVPQGKEEAIAELSVYVNWPEAASRAIIFASDVHGWENPILRTIADKAAAAGFAAFVPDFFHGDPFVPRPGVGDMRYFPWVTEWLKLHTAEGSVEECRSLMTELKRRGITSFGLSGFCWGARLAMLLDGVEELQAIVLLHPSLLKVEAMNSVRAPLAILAAEFDSSTPVETIKMYEDVLDSRPEVQSFVKIYAGTEHGWTVAKPAGEAARRAADEAHHDMLEWYQKHFQSPALASHLPRFTIET